MRTCLSWHLEFADILQGAGGMFLQVAESDARCSSCEADAASLPALTSINSSSLRIACVSNAQQLPG